MIRMKFESFQQYLRGAEALWQAEYDEMVDDKDRLPLEPDLLKYQTVERTGGLIILSVRNEKDELVGHVLTFTYNSPHHKSVKYGFVSTFYLKKEYRSRSLGKEMIKDNEKALKERGIQKIFYAFPKAEYLENFFSQLDYKPSSVIYEKWIGS